MSRAAVRYSTGPVVKPSEAGPRRHVSQRTHRSIVDPATSHTLQYRPPHGLKLCNHCIAYQTTEHPAEMSARYENVAAARALAARASRLHKRGGSKGGSGAEETAGAPAVARPFVQTTSFPRRQVVLTGRWLLCRLDVSVDTGGQTGLRAYAR